MTHFVKCLPEYFRDCMCFQKNWTLRKNDRNYQAGDTLVKFEWIPETNFFTGEVLFVTVSWVIDADNTAMPGIAPGHALLVLDFVTPANWRKTTSESARSLYEANNKKGV